MPKPLRRTVYRERQPPHNIRTGQASRAEIALDVENYYQPLIEALATAHAPGVISGLQVLATAGKADVLVKPGVAIDLLGRVIVLSETGRAEIGSNADAPGAAPHLVNASAEGVIVPTAGLTGTKVLVARWWETFDEQAFSDTGAMRTEHTPWLQIVSVNSFEEADIVRLDRTRIALSLIQFGEGADVGKVTGSLPAATPRIKVDNELEVRRIEFSPANGFSAEKVFTLSPLFGNVASVHMSALDPGLSIGAKEVRIEGDLVVTGNAKFEGRKTGFVADEFCNRGSQPLERGDVVVLAAPTAGGPNRLIPIPEVEIAATPTDRRLCGIVSDGAEPGENGHMVTLGCWAHCKVDADLGAIETGDLLTSSPTPGHAQKVESPAQALGAVLGKALAPLTSGQGVIPVLVSLH
jgi:hypothetical protein